MLFKELARFVENIATVRLLTRLLPLVDLQAAVFLVDRYDLLLGCAITLHVVVGDDLLRSFIIDQELLLLPLLLRSHVTYVLLRLRPKTFLPAVGLATCAWVPARRLVQLVGLEVR